MNLAIDGSNLRSGGGLTHIVEILRCADPKSSGFKTVTIWGSKRTLNQIDNKPWLIKRHDATLEFNFLIRGFWQYWRLPSLLTKGGYDVLWAPGGLHTGKFKTTVVMCRNMLPFERKELMRFGMSLMTLKWLALRLLQAKSFRTATGVIFLTRYALDTVKTIIREVPPACRTIPHGLSDRFRQQSSDVLAQRASTRSKSTVEILYVSQFDAYKHQDKVIEAALELAREGFSIKLKLVGQIANRRSYRLAMRKVETSFHGRQIIDVAGAADYSEIHNYYLRADIFIFASSCENMPNTLLEAMASGLAIASSNKGPMPDILGDAGVYFDPENVEEIANAVRSLINSRDLRLKLAKKALRRSADYSWSRCASETFKFLREIGESAVTRE